MTTRTVVASMMVGLVTGCSTLGPTSVPRDRFDYNTAIATSWMEQSLLNIVKIRYADMPVFVDVASIVAGYTMETQINAGLSFPETATFGGDTISVGGSGRFTDRPTITYVPITGQQFNRSFMTPITPKAVMFLLQTGWAADLVLPMAVDSMNGLRARVAAGANQREGDDEFYRVITLFREIQRSGAVGMRIEQSGQKETTMLLFHPDGVAPEVRDALDELETLLGLERGARELRVTYSQIPEKPDDLAILTRSMFQIMVSLAADVEVPEQHVLDGRTPPSLALDERTIAARPLVIHTSEERPADAFAAVRYHDHWFYIDDRDFRSKRAFAFLMILFSVSETGGHDTLPLVTIPAG